MKVDEKEEKEEENVGSFDGNGLLPTSQ